MRSERDDDAIDAAIAAAAQALTSAAPTTALRAGVRDRIGGHDLVASALRRKHLRRLVPAAAAAVVVVALLLGRSAPQPPGAPVSRPRPSPPALVAVPPPKLDSQPVVEPVIAPRPTRRLAAAFEPPVEEMEPLIPPITIPPLETTQIVMDASSGVMPIEIEPLRIEPLQGE